ncbi:PAS domain S-box-containing protein [Duganella sp. 1411]|uniref:hybrid sensor histidine kinase/response regulator n=1 Tax=Duganella sp. 1411 TaxID=2806572 RepID=UPI001AE1FF9B|nr:ATP-binding protein [Duganella sp. 1411]MBP1203653.1 PAS domain S-box-containing protein [Duganella sp. 1411]
MRERRSSGWDLWEDAPCGLLIAAADGTVMRVNATLSRWIGYEPSELVAHKRLPELMPMGARVFLQTHWTPLLQIQGSVSEVQLDLLHKDGRRVPMMLSAIRRERNGVLQDEIAVLMASDRKLYEREILAARAKAEAAANDLELAQNRLRQANEAMAAEDRRKDEFLATLAHELRNPLAPLSNVIATMELRGADAPPSARELAVLTRQVTQMTRLVDDLMNVSRISQGKIDLRLEPADLVQALRFVAEEALSSIHAAGQSLRVDLPPYPIWGNVDRARLTQIVANLLNNASKYSHSGAYIDLVARIVDGGAVIEVTDDGMGIPADQLDNIFDMFSQLTPALDRAQGGLGIGLSLVKGLVALHGGEVSARSAGVGQGSCFTVRLPLIEAPAATVAVEPIAPTTAASQPASVVIVDDNVDAAETLAAAMEMLGYLPVVANTGRDALRVIGQSPPGAAILDIGLPDMNGYELARKIRGEPWGSAIVLVAATGWGQESDKQAARDAGFDLHFTKPLDFMKLDQQLRPLMTGASAVR